MASAQLARFQLATWASQPEDNSSIIIFYLGFDHYGRKLIWIYQDLFVYNKMRTSLFEDNSV